MTEDNESPRTEKTDKCLFSDASLYIIIKT